jgi:hypothetical protein
LAVHSAGDHEPAIRTSRAKERESEEHAVTKNKHLKQVEQLTAVWVRAAAAGPGDLLLAGALKRARRADKVSNLVEPVEQRHRNS